MADIPGIIEGAHEGRGLGIRFLRHIERNSVLLFCISCTDDAGQTYRTLLKELQAYSPELLDKRRVVAITKCDLRTLQNCTLKETAEHCLQDCRQCSYRR